MAHVYFKGQDLMDQTSKDYRCLKECYVYFVFALAGLKLGLVPHRGPVVLSRVVLLRQAGKGGRERGRGQHFTLNLRLREQWWA